MTPIHELHRSMSPGAASSRSSLQGTPATTFIAGMTTLAVLITALMVWRMPPADLPGVFIWAAAALVGELLVFSTLTQRAQVNMATTVHMAMILMVAPGQMLCALWLSRIVAKFLLQRQPWYRALFNVAQVVVATMSAWGAYAALGGRSWEGGPPAQLSVSAGAFVAAGLTYHLINTFSVSRIVSLTTHMRLWRTWRDNYGYPMEIMNTWALVLLAPVVVLCVIHLSWVGLLVFAAPVVLLRQVSAEYVKLQNSQRSLVAAERVAAKNEISAFVGHRINAALTTLSGQVQLVIMRRERISQAELDKRFGMIQESVEAIQRISQGLIDACQQSRRLEWSRLDSVMDTVQASLKKHAAMTGVTIETHCDSTIEELLINRAQIQDVLRHLLLNAGEALQEVRDRPRKIQISAILHPQEDEVELVIADNGPGISEDALHHVFEPGYSTRSHAGGFGLSTALRIVTNHKGQIALENADEGGVRVRILLPGGARKAA